jgi:tetratricopeptide (TPR) repeat protein
MLGQFRASKALWENSLQEALSKLHALLAELHEPVPPEFASAGEDLCVERLDAIKAAADTAQRERERRVEAVGFLVAQVGELFKQLAMSEEECLSREELVILRSDPNERLGLATTTITALETACERLAVEKRRRDVVIADLLERVAAESAKLAVSEEEQHAFRVGMAQFKSSKTAIALLQEEVARLREERARLLPDIIARERVRVVELCAALRLSPEESAATMSSLPTEDQASEEALAAHEALREQLAAQLALYAPVLAMIQQREEWRAEIVRTAEAAKDPTRLRKANSKAVIDHERHMEEVKRKDLPELEAAIEAAIAALQAEHGVAFRFEGGEYVQRMRFENDEDARAKAEKLRAKRMQKAGAAATPAGNVTRTPPPPRPAGSGARLSRTTSKPSASGRGTSPTEQSEASATRRHLGAQLAEACASSDAPAVSSGLVRAVAPSTVGRAPFRLQTFHLASEAQSAYLRCEYERAAELFTQALAATAEDAPGARSDLHRQRANVYTALKQYDRAQSDARLAQQLQEEAQNVARSAN